MAWTAPRDWVTGEIVTAALMNTHIRDNTRYLKGLDGVPVIESGLTIDNTDGDERLLLPLLSTAECSTVLNATGEVAFDEQTLRIKYFDGTSVISIGDLATAFIASQAQGDVFYASSSTALARLAAGTSGQFLKTQGAGANPVWDGSLTPELTLYTWDDFVTGTLETGEVGCLNWSFVVSGSITRGGGMATVVNHPGSIRLATDTTQNNTAYMFQSAAATDDVLLAADLWEVTFIIFLEVFTTCKILCGVIDDISASSTNQHRACFEFSTATDTYWTMCTGSGAAETRTATDTTPAQAWYKLKIKRLSGAAGVEFYINDTLKGTVTGTLPTSTMNYGFYIQNLSAVGNYIADSIDFFSLKLPGLTR